MVKLSYLDREFDVIYLYISYAKITTIFKQKREKKIEILIIYTKKIFFSIYIFLKL